MKNYFDFDDRPINDDTCDRFENRSRFSLQDAVNYDKEYVNRILNKANLDDADRYNIASAFNETAETLLATTQDSKSFEEFMIEVMGKKWYENLIAKWLQRKTNELAKNWNCPELRNNKGIYLYNPNEDI